MGINASFTLINSTGINTNSIAHAFVRFFKSKGIGLVNKQYLTVHKWESNHFLFGIGITPITCFNLEGWEGEKDWTLITFSSFPQKGKGWELELSTSLMTKIECHGVYDTSSIYTECRIEKGQYLKRTLDLNENSSCIEEIKGEIRKPISGPISIDCAGVEYVAAADYYSLKNHPGRVNIEGEKFIVFQDDDETSFQKNNDNDGILEFDEDIPF